MIRAKALRAVCGKHICQPHSCLFFIFYLSFISIYCVCEVELSVTIEDLPHSLINMQQEQVSIIVEADPEVLCDKIVQTAVEGRFCDSAISVREAALELVGRHIASHPDVGLKVFQLPVLICIPVMVGLFLSFICLSVFGFFSILRRWQKE